MAFAQIILQCRAAAPVEVTSLSSGKQKARLRIYRKRDYKNKEGKYDSDFFTVETFLQSKIDFLKNYVEKNTPLIIEGEPRIDSYTNKDGKKVEAFVINLNNAYFDGPRPSASPAQNGGQNGTHRFNQNAPQKSAAQELDEYVAQNNGGDSEELPFA